MEQTEQGELGRLEEMDGSPPVPEEGVHVDLVLVDMAPDILDHLSLVRDFSGCRGGGGRDDPRGPSSGAIGRHSAWSKTGASKPRASAQQKVKKPTVAQLATSLEVS